MKQQLVDKFQQIYGDGAVTGIYFAPGRVNLIGEHTDYNGGHVFPCAITMGTYALVRKRTDNRFRIRIRESWSCPCGSWTGRGNMDGPIIQRE